MSYTAISARIEAFRTQLFRLTEGERSPLGQVVALLLLNLILLNLVAVILETMPRFADRYSRQLDLFEGVSIAVFTGEYLLRLWSCTANPRYRHPLWGRLRYAASPLAIVDLIAILPAYVPGDVFLDLRYARIVRLIRLLRIFKVARYSETLHTFRRVVTAKAWDLGVISFFLAILLVVSSITMYFAEHHAQPAVFSSVPAAMWWGVETVTTVGYGDMYPITPGGKFLGSIIALLGIGFFALPAGILAAGFADEVQRERASKRRCPHCGKELP